MVTIRSFSRGEVSPTLQKRADLESYSSSLKTCRNWKVKREGGAETRPGTWLSAPVKYSADNTKDVIVREFIFNASSGNTYAIEVGDQYMRFHKNRQQIRYAGVTITGITNANPGVLSYTGTDPSNGDEIYVSGVFGMTEANGRWYIVGNVNGGANTLELKNKAGTNVNTTSFGTYTSGGTFEKVYEISTSYSGSIGVQHPNDTHIRQLSFAQLNDVINIAGGLNGYAPMQLVRSGDTSWALGTLPIKNYTQMVIGAAGALGAGGAKTFKYKVSYIPIGGAETLPGTAGTKTVSGITQANPAVVTCTAHGFNTGDRVVLEGVLGMTEINGREFQITVASPFVPDAPITITSISQASPMVVTKNSHGLSNGDKIQFSVTGMTELNEITNGTVTSAAANTFQVYYFGTTTKIDSTGYAAFTAGTVTRISPNATATNSFTLTNVDSTGYTAYSSAGNAARTHVQIDLAADPTTSAPNVISWSGITTSGSFSGAVTSGVKEYVIYRELNGVYGFIGTAPGTSTSFNDIGIVPDTADEPFQYAEPFFASGDYPYCVGYGRQRFFWGGSDNHPRRIVGAVKGDYYNYSTHNVPQADDAVTIDLVGDRTQIVRSIKEVSGRVIAFCSEGEYGLGDDEGVIDATAPAAKQFSANGSTVLRPLLVNNIATFVQARSGQVRDLGFSFQDNNYKGDERSTRSSHLFKGYVITDWCYQQVPDSTIFATRNDGVMLGCTYVREEQEAAWHRHDVTDGNIRSVCSIPGTNQDDVYAVVIHNTFSGNGVTASINVEVFDTRFIGPASVTYPTSGTPGATTAIDPDDNIAEHSYMDGAVTYDGRYMRSSGVNVRLQGGTTWASGESMTLHCDTAGTFTGRGSENIGNTIILHTLFSDYYSKTPTDYFIKCAITAYTDGQTLTVTPDRAIPVAARTVYFMIWSYAQPYITGLWHLNGHTVSVIGDGFVEASALNPDYGAALTVTNGRVNLTNAHEVIHAGKPFICDLETLDIDSVQAPGGGLIRQSKIVNQMDIAVEQTRALYIGQQAPEDDTDNTTDSAIYRLEPLVDRRTNDMSYDEPQPTETDTIEQDCIGTWQTHGRCFIRQVDPLPATILAIMPTGVTLI